MLNYLETIKKSTAYNIVKKDCESERLSHAYLFVSGDENYLKVFCEQVCKLLINLNSDYIEKNNLRIDNRIHPDVMFYAEDKAIDTKTATQIVEESDYSPFESDKKIFVIFNVQSMNESAQNKILKTIEEPPKNTYFILAATDTNRILQTIKSRVKEIKVEQINNDEITNMLIEKNIPQNKADIFASCSAGNSTIAEKFALNSTFIKFYQDIVSMLENLDGSKDVLRYSVLFNDKKVDKDEMFSIIELILRDSMMILSGQVDLVVNKTILNSLKIIAKKTNINGILELIKKVNKCKEMLTFNVNSTAVIDEFLYKLAEVKVKCRKS